MGYVYRAVHVPLGLPCAIKILRDAPLSRGRRSRTDVHGRSAREDMVARFHIEARALSQLDHPNIVRLLDFGRDEEADLWFLAAEHLEGHDLTDALNNAEPALPVARIVALARQLCAALQHAHDAGVVHRDVKPDNLRLVPRRGPEGQRDERHETLKLLDFGTARLIAGAAAAAGRIGCDALLAEDLERPVIGTPAYMSPEQASGLEAGPLSDVYSCGVLLFEMATGRLPFEMPTSISLAAAHVECEPPPPRDANPEIDPDLEHIILWCLRKDPADRPPSARALGEALDQAGVAAALRGRSWAAPPSSRCVLRGAS